MGCEHRHGRCIGVLPRLHNERVTDGRQARLRQIFAVWQAGSLLLEIRQASRNILAKYSDARIQNADVKLAQAGLSF